MEQEPESPILYSTLRRVGYKLVLAVHLFFIIISFMAAVTLLTALLMVGI